MQDTTGRWTGRQAERGARVDAAFESATDSGRASQRYRAPVQNITARVAAVPAGRIGRRVAAVAAGASTLTALSFGLAGGAWAEDGAGSTTNVQGSLSAGHWPWIQTLGVFIGIPIALALLIVGLVMAGPAIRSGRESIGSEAFSGPHAGPVDVTPDDQRSGTPGVDATGVDAPRAGATALGAPGVEAAAAGSGAPAARQGGAGAEW